jgi:hypothetical protein
VTRVISNEMAEDFSIESTMGGSVMFTIEEDRGEKGLSNIEQGTSNCEMGRPRFCWFQTK